MGGQVVDTLTAEEFMQQVLQKISKDELDAIAAEAATRSERVRALIGDPSTPVDDDTARALLGLMFGVRRKAGTIIESFGPGGFGRAASELLAAPASIDERFDAFIERMAAFDEHAVSVAGELLHGFDPDRYWLWTKWMWDPRTETGSLRLVTMEEVDLWGETPGKTYLKVGEAVAFVNETGRAVGFTQIGGGPFGVDVFLACTYGIYMYTVLRMRMTQEFNHVVPQLPELARRLLGVYRLEG